MIEDIQNFEQIANSNGDASSLDLNKLRLPQDFGDIIGGKKGLTTIPVRRPDPQAFIRVHSAPEFQLLTAVLEVREDRELFLVDRSLWDELSLEIVPKALYTAITKQGNVFLWPVRLPDPDGKQLDTWNTSAHEIAERAKTDWLRVISNRQVGAYEYREPSMTFPDPEWPAYTFRRLLELAFKERFIQDVDHPVVKRLRGQP